MVSKSEIKRISRLHLKKYRYSEGLFIVEGVKAIGEFLASDYPMESLYALDPGLDDFEGRAEGVSESELKRMTALKTPNQALGVFKMRRADQVSYDGLTLVLDDVRDPGNLGTIIRLCDWFGVTDLVCSKETADCYNPKVVQATMGSLGRVNVVYADLIEFFSEYPHPVCVTAMDGEDLYQVEAPASFALVMGNEAHGVSPQIMNLAGMRVTIPRFGNRQLAESLNVATATSVCLSEFRRKALG
ncbi:TrmH family RNA methyltransferase [Robertkochia aurantiaca]|uniref:TrmH family RNA methyltransferase n=1 Tax=Robertkochia aurantiaca TaxID=2873700 RepID=UPI001CCC1B95|nr:RNA methyltransferase [Robertkochia sp. 3YJGBD-33]